MRLHRAGWVAPAALALLLYLGLVLRAGAADGFRFFAPIRAGSVYAVPGELLPGMRLDPGTGYDGQFYFFLAQDPFLRHPQTAASLDSPFRVRRILYPLLAWVLSLGHREAVPAVLILLNLVCCTTLVGLCAYTAATAGRSPWSALAVGLFAGVWIPLLLDLTEPLHLVLLAAGMIASSTSLLLLSALAKESSAVVLGTELVRAAVARRWRAAAVSGGALALFAGWSLFVQLVVRTGHSHLAAPSYLTPPGAPFIALVQAARTNPAVLALTGPAVAICLLALVRLRTARDAAAWAAAAYALLVLGSELPAWSDPTGYFRIMAGAVVLAYLSWCRNGDREGWLINVLAAGTGILSLGVLLVPRT